LLAPAPTVTETRRTLIKFSRRRGIRKTVPAVPNRFMWLGWGAWIRTRSMKKKRLWKKQETWKKTLQYHVLCNKQQTKLLKHMTTKFWRTRRFYPEDPYEPYHSRNWYKE